ncbi:MAG: right-handed parallel beta-helix repeat-containing protein [Planctomycetes bacterium]|nr:right-handed parallel beta-helix repeat-containing protein [Planctomycetota bacterium]
MAFLNDRCHAVRPVLVAACLLLPRPSVAQRVIYVSAAAAGTNDGTSWSDAYVDLQDALDDARGRGECPCEVWIAAGVYRPDRGTGDREASFELADLVDLYGGFAGWESCRAERDSRANPTILSGDLLGDDDLDPPVASNCCVAYGGPGCDSATCQAAVVAHMSRPTCALGWQEGCSTLAEWLCCEECRPTRCDNSYNVLRIRQAGARTLIDGLTITGGEANPTDDQSYPTGGGLLSLDASPRIQNAAFVANAGKQGGAVYARGGEPAFRDSVFQHNECYGGDQCVVDALGNEPDFTSCDFLDNRGCGLSTDGDQRIEGCRFIGNSGTGLDAWIGAPFVLDTVFAGNHSGWGGGMSSGGYPTLVNCRFYGNHATLSGGGFYSGGFGAVLANCLFSGNQAFGPGYSGGACGAVSHRLGPLTVLSSTFVGNSAQVIGGLYSAGSVTVSNSVFWGNTDARGDVQAAQLDYDDYFSSLTINHSTVEGWDTTYGGVGNSGLDPLFADPDGPDDILGTEDDNLRLAPDSPAINAGQPSPPLYYRKDLDNHARILYGRIDQGAYEFGIGDYSGDRAVTPADFTAWSSCSTPPQGVTPTGTCTHLDFNADSDVDLEDFAGFARVFGP